MDDSDLDREEIKGEQAIQNANLLSLLDDERAVESSTLQTTTDQAPDQPLDRAALRKRVELMQENNARRFGRDIRPPKDTGITAPSFAGNVGQADDLDVSLAPGCYGMSMCYREGTPECSTCPFAASCGPLAARQLAMLRADGGESRKDLERRDDRDRTRRSRERAKPSALSKPIAVLAKHPAPPLSRSKAMLEALEKAIAGRRSTDRFLEKLGGPERRKEYAGVAIIAWLQPALSAAKIADLYNAKTGKTGKDALDKKKVENRLKRVKELVARGIWKPFQSGADQ
ncbi:hypothetical protein [Bradyrhizobium liaoningense]